MESDAYRRLQAQRAASKKAAPAVAKPVPNATRPPPVIHETQPARRAKSTPEAADGVYAPTTPRRPKKSSHLDLSAGVATLSASLAFGAATLSQVHSPSHRYSSYQEDPTSLNTPQERTEPVPIRTQGFERAPFGSPTNEEVSGVEEAMLPPQYRIPVQFIRVADAPVPMPTSYGIPGFEAAHFDIDRQEVLIGPQIVAELDRQPVNYIYNHVLLHEDGHAFNWDSAPNLTPEQRELYRVTFIRHLQDGRPRIYSRYVNAIHNPDPAQTWEFKAIEYQAELVSAILSLPFPEYRTGSWEEAIAQKLHTIHHIPLTNARYEVRLFCWMIELVFPGRSPESMHRDVQTAIQRAVEQGSYRINTTVLHRELAPELHYAVDQAFILPRPETWLRQYIDRSTTTEHPDQHRPSSRQELLRQRVTRVNQLRVEIERRSENTPLVRDFFEQADLIGRHFHSNRLPRRTVIRLQNTYARLSRHDQQVVQYYLPTYGQLLQFKPSLYHIDTTLAQTAQAHAN